jgi:hypothetical protein
VGTKNSAHTRLSFNDKNSGVTALTGYRTQAANPYGPNIGQDSPIMVSLPSNSIAPNAIGNMIAEAESLELSP